MFYPHIFGRAALSTALTLLGSCKVPLNLCQSAISRNLSRSTAYLTKAYFLFHDLGERQVAVDPIRNIHKPIKLCLLRLLLILLLHGSIVLRETLVEVLAKALLLVVLLRIATVLLLRGLLLSL